jgi:hypothetical protein
VGGGHEQQQEGQEQQAAPPPILQSLASTAATTASNEIPTEQGNNNHDTHQQQQQELEQPRLSTSTLLGLATKAATAAKEAQEAARAAANAAAEAAQASKTAADAAAAMAEALHQLHLQEEKVAAAARLVPLQQERRQEAWEFCVSPGLLASFLLAPDLCALSTCSHLHLPVRRQVSILKVEYFTPSLLSKMAAGHFAELRHLHVERTFVGFPNSKEYIEAAKRAFSQMHKLEGLCLHQQPRAFLCSIFEAMGVESKRRIKTLSLGLMMHSVDSEMPNSYYNSILFRGLTSLESLTLRCLIGGNCYEALKNGNFPRLQTLTILDETTEFDLDNWQHLMLRGSLRHVSSLTLNFVWCAQGGGQERIEKLLPLLPRLSHLCLTDLAWELDAAVVEHLMTLAAEEECQVSIIESEALHYRRLYGY